MLKPYAMQQKDELIAYLEGRSEEINADIMLKVTDILNNVRLNKDDALKYYTKCFDGIELDDFKVSEAELAAQAALADPDFVVAMQNASHNIEVFHQAQVQSGYRLDKEYGIYLGQRVLPLDSVGIYVPGGRAQYPSSVLMNAIPARIAGVKRIVMITPPSKEGGLHPNIAAAAKIAGVTEIF